MTKKKIISTLMVGILAISTLAACGKEEIQVEDEVSEALLGTAGDNNSNDSASADASGTEKVTDAENADADDQTDALQNPSDDSSDGLTQSAETSGDEYDDEAVSESGYVKNPYLGYTSTATDYEIKFTISTDSGLAGIVWGFTGEALPSSVLETAAASTDTTVGSKTSDTTATTTKTSSTTATSKTTTASTKTKSGASITASGNHITGSKVDNPGSDYYIVGIDLTTDFPRLYTSRREIEAKTGEEYIFEEEYTNLDMMYPDMSMYEGVDHYLDIQISGTSMTVKLDSYTVYEGTLNDARPIGQIGTWVQKGNYHETIDDLFAAEGVNGDGEWLYSEDFSGKTSIFSPYLSTKDGALYAKSGLYFVPRFE